MEINYSKATFFISIGCLVSILTFFAWRVYKYEVTYQQVDRPMKEKAYIYATEILPNEMVITNQKLAKIDDVLHSILFDNKEFRAGVKNRNSAKDEKDARLSTNVEWIAKAMQQNIKIDNKLMKSAR